MAEDEMYLENLQEFVVQEERIVTYKWLSRTLSVNVNQAKQMLYAFVQHQQNDKNTTSLSIIYILGGLIKTGDGSLIQKYLFARENDLEDIKQCYDKLTSLHIYSVQKCHPKDSNVLYMADYDLQKENLDCPNRCSNITCKSAVKRTSEIQNGHEDNDQENKEKEKEKEKATSSEVPKPLKSDPKDIAPQTNRYLRENRDINNEFKSRMGKLKPVPSTSTKKSKSTAKSSMKKGDVASFFARQTSKNKAEAQKSNNAKIPEDLSQKSDVTKANEENKIERNQNESDGTSKDKIVKDEKEKETEATVKDNKDSECKTTTVNKEKLCTKKSSPNQDEKKKKETKKQKEKDVEKLAKKGVKRNKSKNSPQEGKDGKRNDEENKRKRKKRKRVKDLSDTSSEEEAESADLKQSGSSANSTPIPDQQPQETVPKTESSGPQNVRRRKRVLKSKTYLNDEGYMVTEKVYESESTDGSDVEMKEAKVPDGEVKKNTEEKEKAAPPKNKSAPPKKKPGNKATKQSSLTNFFKKS